MSTEYHHRHNVCDCCGRYDEQQIGTSAIGWTFTFFETDAARTVDDWRRILKTGMIVDEYGREMSYDGFFVLIEGKQAMSHRNHAVLYPDHAYLDPNGYAFVRR